LEFYNASKTYGQKTAMNEIFNWLLGHFMTLMTSSDVLDAKIKQIDEELLLNLLRNKSFAVSSEWKLYTFLKRWMIADLKKRDELSHFYADQREESFLESTIGEKYKKLFELLRVNCLLGYIENTQLLYDERIISRKLLNQKGYELYETIQLINSDPKFIHVPPDFEQNAFRFSKLITNRLGMCWTNDFFCHGVQLLFNFDPAKCSATRLAKTSSQMNLQQLNNFGSIVVRTRVTCYNTSFSSSPCRVERSEIKDYDNVRCGIEQPFHFWQRPISYPCVLFLELQVYNSPPTMLPTLTIR